MPKKPTSKPAAKPKRKPAAKPKATLPVTLAELAGIVGAPFDDPRLVAIVARLGGKPPKPSTGYLDAKPHGVSLNFDGEPPRMTELCLSVTKSTDLGMWTGDLPEGLSRDSTPAQVTRGTRTDKPAETEFVIDDGVLKTFIVFNEGVLDQVNLVATS